MTREQELARDNQSLLKELRTRDLRIESLTLERDAAKEARDQMEQTLNVWQANARERAR